ncbi:hypothetical protein PSE_0889 [Pseudovibrio sp. FO-BEG1]|nr:hypothetical protein PSE_0889 [Pseudovibrio sp. FO-BEG1]
MSSQKEKSEVATQRQSRQSSQKKNLRPMNGALCNSSNKKQNQ